MKKESTHFKRKSVFSENSFKILVLLFLTLCSYTLSAQIKGLYNE